MDTVTHLVAFVVIGTTIYYTLLPRTMWDVVPVLYWRTKKDGKYSWQKAKVAFVPNMGLYAIEPPVMKVNESEGESE